MNTKNATPERGENDATAPQGREEAEHGRNKNASPEEEKRVVESERKPAKKAVKHVRHRPLL